MSRFGKVLELSTGTRGMAAVRRAASSAVRRISGNDDRTSPPAARDAAPAQRPCEALEHRLMYYNVSPYDWPQPGGAGEPVNLTYSYANLLDGTLPGGLTAGEIRSAVTEALSLWSAVAPLRFTEVADSGPTPGDSSNYSPTGHPQLRFGHHSIDGASGVLAHAYYPDGTGLGGDTHFDTDESWGLETDGFGTFDVIEIAAHEIGHALGLAHSDELNSIMYPFHGAHYNGPGTGFLFQDDIDGMRAIYGSNSGFVLDDGTLTIRGADDVNNSVALSTAGSTLTVTIDGEATTLPAASVSEIILAGGGGNDTLNASGVNVPVSLDGGSGHDVLTGGSGNDTLVGGGGNDALDGGNGTDHMTGDTGADSFTGGGGSGDEVSYRESFRTAGVTVTFDGDPNDGASGESDNLGTGIEAVDGTDFADSVNAQFKNTGIVIAGNLGNDTLVGGTGDDTLLGGDGTDRMTGNDGGDLFDGGGGSGDEVNYTESWRTAGVTVTFDGDPNDGAAGEGDNLGTGIEAVNGTAHADSINAQFKNTGILIAGFGGIDTLTGGSGNDTLLGGNGNDILNGLGGTDRADQVGSDTRTSIEILI